MGNTTRWKLPFHRKREIDSKLFSHVLFKDGNYLIKQNIRVVMLFKSGYLMKLFTYAWFLSCFFLNIDKWYVNLWHEKFIKNLLLFNFKVLFILGSSLLCHALTLILCLYFHYYEKDSLQIFVAAFYNALKNEKEAFSRLSSNFVFNLLTTNLLCKSTDW